MRSKRKHNFIQRYRKIHLFIAGWVFFAGLLLYLFFPFTVFSQEQQENEEISVSLRIQQLGSVDIPAIVRENEAYLPVTVLFDYLKIKNIPSRDFDSVSGFFITQDAVYLIDQKHLRITYRENVFELKPNDIILTEEGLFLNLSLLGKVFGLNCSFNFRNLAILMTTKVELPVIREMRQEEMHRNLRALKGESKADTIMKRRYPFFHFGMADWSVIATEMSMGPYNVRLNLGLGGILAGGETNILLNYSNGEPFTEKQQYYLWRYANNANPFLRQIMAGKINTQAASSIYSPVVGAQLTNAPTTYRRAFGTFTLSDHTEPGWIVELYVNNVLVNFVKADPSGFFTFEVPLVYGNSMVKLRFYGPWGEERTKERNINVPFNFLPLHEFEYTVSGGMVEDSNHSIYSRANVNYGLAKRITIGAGVEYLSSVTSGQTMPFVNLSLRLASSLLISAEYMYGVRFKGILNYSLPSSFQVELDYTKYHEGQTAINFNYLEERKAIMSMPVRAKNISFFMRLTLDQIILPTTYYTTAEFVLSGAFLGIGTNFTTYALFPNPGTPNVYSNLSLGFRLHAGFTITPQAQYDYNQQRFISVKCELEKRIFRQLYATLSYEQNFSSQVYNAQFGLRYDFSAAHTELLVKQSNQLTTLFQSARGSIICDPGSGYVDFNNRINVGRGGIVLVPFLDLNQNGKRDKGEPKVSGLTFSINGGRIETDNKDTITRILDLEPYVNYIVELNRNSFENIAWQIRNRTLGITVEPNTLKMVEIPVTVAGEASGTVFVKSSRGTKGQGRIFVCFYRDESVLVARTITEPGGFFSYLGLAPGSYSIRMDTLQLSKLQMNSIPASIHIIIKKSIDGDVVEGLEFVLQSNESGKEEIYTPGQELKPDHPDLGEMKIKSSRKDSLQLGKLQMIPVPASIPVIIKKNIDGDVVKVPEFVLQPGEIRKEESHIPKQGPKPDHPDTGEMKIKARAGIISPLPVRSPKALKQGQADSALSYYNRAKGMINNLPSGSRNVKAPDTLTSSTAEIRVKKISTLASAYCRQGQFAKAIMQFEQARKIAAAYSLKPDPVNDSLYHQSYKQWLLDQISRGEQLIWNNKPDSAHKFLLMATETARSKGLERDPEILKALASYRSAINNHSCKPMEDSLVLFNIRAGRCFAIHDYNRGVMISQYAIDRAVRMGYCNLDINALKDSINKYSDAAEYQKNLHRVNLDMTAGEYERGFQLLAANEKLYTGKRIDHFGISLTSVYDYVMMKADPFITIQALEYYIDYNDPVDALRYLMLLHVQGLPEDRSNFYQEKLALYLAARDKLAYVDADPRNIVLRYTSSNAWMSRFTEVYIQSWEK